MDHKQFLSTKYLRAPIKSSFTVGGTDSKAMQGIANDRPESI